ncbi:MAG: hypothetical protein ACM3S1_05245 [Hyphomicrobiales bacterium]
METWDLWYPNAAARGLSFGRGAMDPADAVIVHAVPDTLRVEVTDGEGRRIAFGDQLVRTGPYYPMTRLRKQGSRITREDGWPEAEDIGRPVMLPGGEVGILKDWWNAEDGSEWRWNVEFYNHK